MVIPNSSTLVVPTERFTLFAKHLENTPILQDFIRTKNEPEFFIALAQDLWFSLYEQRYEPILDLDALDTHPLIYTIMHQFIHHPTYHYFYELSHQEGQNTFTNAFLIADFLVSWLEVELEGKTFDSEKARLHYLFELTSITAAFEGAAQYLTHMYHQLLASQTVDELIALEFHEQAAIQATLLFENASSHMTKHLYQAKYVYKSIV